MPARCYKILGLLTGSKEFHGSQSPIKLLKVSHCYKKSYFFNMVQPIDLIFCKVIEMIEQNIFNHADFSFRS